jgi:DNA-binding NtrC family response regulator
LPDKPLHFLVVTRDPTISHAIHGLGGEDRQVMIYDETNAIFAADPDDVHFLLLDEAVTGGGYLPVIRKARKRYPGVETFVVGGPKSDEVRLAEKKEAVDYYYERPLEEREFEATLRHRVQLAELKARAGIVGRSPRIEEILEAILQVGPSEVPILIEGESGTGKDVIARAVHHASRRHDKAYVAINCASLAEGVLESELFGHEKGAFTGAVGQRAGVFEQANNGTIFLDEVGEMSPSMQVRLLRVLETGEVLRVGGVKRFHVDVRVIAATNRSLQNAVNDGHFRQDLYYRLKGVSFHLPALRQRTEDIPLLVDYFIREANRRHGKSVKGIDAGGLRMIEKHEWPGNIRELRNAVDTAVVLTPGARITADQIASQLGDATEVGPSLPVPLHRSSGEAERQMIYASVLAMHRDVREVLDLLRQALGGRPMEGWREVRVEDENPVQSLVQQERNAIAEALRSTGGNRRKASQMLGISERTLYRKIKEYGLV